MSRHIAEQLLDVAKTFQTLDPAVATHYEGCWQKHASCAISYAAQIIVLLEDHIDGSMNRMHDN